MEITDRKIRRTWTAYTLIADIARYLCISPLKAKKILSECVDGMDVILAKVNEFNELLHDKIIPFVFNELYEIEEFEKKESKDIDIINDPEGGSYHVHGKEELTEFFNDWQKDDKAGFEKSFHLDTYCFDSEPEKYFFERIIKSDDVKEVYFTGMLTHGQSEFYINYIDPDTKCVRNYYPDFLILTRSGEWLVVEVKASNQIDEPVVQAKKAFAEEFLKDSHIKYRMVPHNEAGTYNIFSPGDNKHSQNDLL